MHDKRHGTAVHLQKSSQSQGIVTVYCTTPKHKLTNAPLEPPVHDVRPYFALQSFSVQCPMSALRRGSVHIT
jgi:hypothetical protein